MRAGNLRHEVRVMLFAAVGLILIHTLAGDAFAGTYRNDFDVEAEFLEDKEAGVWNLDLNAFNWEDGAIRGTGRGVLLMFGMVEWTDYTLEVMVSVKAHF